MIFSSEAALHSRAHFPDCISGVFNNHDPTALSEFDGKKVVVAGRSFDFETLKAEDAPLLKRKLLAGSVVPNFCFGKRVLLVKSIEFAS